MEGSVLEEKLRKLQSTQETINATADYLIENSAEAKRIVRTWNEVGCPRDILFRRLGPCISGVYDFECPQETNSVVSCQ